MVLESSARPHTRDTHMRLRHIHILPTVAGPQNFWTSGPPLLFSFLTPRNKLALWVLKSLWLSEESFFQKSKTNRRSRPQSLCWSLAGGLRGPWADPLGCLLACGCCPQVRCFYSPALPSDPAPAAAPALRSLARGV